MQYLLNGSLLAHLSDGITRMLASPVLSFLVGVGIAMSLVILTINITNQGRDMVIGLASDHPVAALVPIVMPYLGVLAALSFWVVPVPGVGLTWPGIVTHSVDHVVNQINLLSVQGMLKTLDAMRLNMSLPFASVSEWVYWAAIQFFMMLLEIIALVISGLAMLGTALCIMVAPLALPCFLTRRMEWLAMGWLRGLTMASTLPITLALIEAMVGSFIVNSLLDMSQGGILDFVNDFVAICFVCVLGIASMILGTIFHNSVCSGSMTVGSGLLTPMLSRLRVSMH